MEHADLRRHILEPIVREYQAAFRALRESVMAFPYEEWISGERKANQPVRQACHLLFGVESYLGGHKARMGGRFGIRVESFKSTLDPAQCPPPKAILPWIDEAEGIANAFIAKAVDASLTGTAKRHPPLNRVLYVLRHTIVHLAILRRELFERGIDRPRY